MFQVMEFTLKDDDTFLGYMQRMVKDLYKDLGNMYPTAAFHHADIERTAIMVASEPLMKIIEKAPTNQRVEADQWLKSMLLNVIHQYIDKKNPTDYVFITEMWMKFIDLDKTGKTADEVRSEYRSGDLARDLKSEEGVMLHYESATEYLTEIYKVKRKYEQGKVLEEYNSFGTHLEDWKSPQGNFCNMLFKL